MSSIGRGRPERIEVGGLLAGVGGALLLISLFLDWFDPGLSAWTVFEALDLVLGATALAALAFAGRSLGLGSLGPTAATAAGAIALVVVVSALIDQPPAVLEQDPEVGAWLALAAASLMLLGSLMSRTGISLAMDVERPGYGPTAADPPGTTRGTPADPGVARTPASPPAGGAGANPAGPTTPLNPEQRR